MTDEQNETEPFRLVYHRRETFGRFEAPFKLREEVFDDLLNNPNQIVRFTDYYCPAVLWNKREPTGRDSLGEVSYSRLCGEPTWKRDHVEGRVRIHFGRAQFKTEEEYDTLCEKMQKKFQGRKNRGGWYPCYYFNQKFHENIHGIIRGDDSEFEYAYYDDFRADFQYIRVVPRGDILVERPLNGGELGAEFSGAIGVAEYFRPLITSEGCHFLGKILNAKVTMTKRSLNDELAGTGISVIATLGDTVRGTGPDTKRRCLKIEPLEKKL
ncbi:MAG: hypothetical protein KJ771_00020 [Nanoarchaeota archaeon]|nr:hypothetical protein [Nanoarchaeota archaeon]